MGRKIVFASGKGGVGKSTIAANVAVAASQLGEKVVLLDSDVPMADLALSMGLEIEGPTLHEVLSGESEVQEAIYSTSAGVKILPAGISLNAVRKANPQRLQDVITQLSEEFEEIIIDAPSGLGQVALTTLDMSDELVLITDPVVTSLSEALRTKEVSERFGTESLGVVVSRVSSAEMEVPRREIQLMLGLPILGEIPVDPEIRKSTSRGIPVVIQSPDSPGGEALRELALEIFGKGGEVDYEKLVSGSVEEIKEKARELNLNYKILLEFEKKNKNRNTLKSWLKSKIDEME